MRRVILHKEVTDLITTRFDVVETINLINYDCEIDTLVSLLSQYQDYVFGPDQRIVILHHDTDYYQVDSHKVEGNTMFNLFTLFSNFNIACEKIVFVTNHYGIQDEIDRLSVTICNSAAPMVIYTSLWYDFPTLKDITSPVVLANSINNAYCCLNGVQRQHRILALCYLKELGLIEHGMISHSFNQ
jgi:hypothetical protein